MSPWGYLESVQEISTLSVSDIFNGLLGNCVPCSGPKSYAAFTQHLTRIYKTNEIQKIKMIQSTFIPKFLFAELQNPLWGTFTIILAPCTAGFVSLSLETHHLGLSSYPWFAYESIKINTCKRVILYN